MNKLIKFIAASIIIFTFILGAIVGWKIVDSICQETYQDAQCPFSSSRKDYGKR
jgi:hypothetical protein